MNICMFASIYLCNACLFQLMPISMMMINAHMHLMYCSHFPRKIPEFTALLQRLIDTYELV